MNTRRLAGLLLLSSMLHLSFVRADLVCATHTHAGATSKAHHSGAMHGEMITASAAAHAASGVDQGEPCEIPVQVKCCQALASCSVVAFSDRDDSRSDVRVVRFGVVAATADAPASLIVSPDPPPPKA